MKAKTKAALGSKTETEEQQRERGTELSRTSFNATPLRRDVRELANAVYVERASRNERRPRRE
jgi:hypothetical protein